MLQLRLIWLLSGALMFGCGAPPVPPPSTPPPPSAADGNMRLDRSVIPTAYALDLTVDPAAASLAGAAEIRITLAEPRQSIVLHAAGLTLEAPVVRSAGTLQTGRVIAGKNGAVTLAFDAPVRAGTATLQLKWTATIGDAPTGLYRVKVGADWYALTQLAPTQARTVFPCFDEPAFKTAFRVVLRVPEAQLGVSNGPESGRAEEDGRTRYSFAETQPLPTSRMAFAVGPFDVAAAPPDALDATLPLRVIATRGKGVLAGYALSQAPLIYAALRRFYGRAQGAQKIDLLAIPGAAGLASGAGLVGIREALLLVDRKAPPRRRLWAQTAIAHQLAQLWMGALVTLAWWDDLWLEEAFATWLAARVVAEIEPGLEADLEEVAKTQWIMTVDASQQARAIRRPIRDGSEIGAAYDGMAFSKGAALLRMTEAWLGADDFSAGVRAFLNARASGTATASDLFDALSTASKKPVDTMLAGFLDAPGVPRVSARIDCAKAAIHLSQGPAASTTPWSVPVCLRLGFEARDEVRCLLLDAPSKTYPLGADACPTWWHPNADQRGYYTWRMLDQAPPAAIAPVDLAAFHVAHGARLSVAERAALPGILWSLLDTNAMSVAPFAEVHGMLVRDPHRVVVQGALAGLARLDAVAVDAKSRPKWSALMRSVLKPHFDRLGTIARSDDTPANARLRRTILNALVHLGDDPSLKAQAKEITRRFLGDARSVPRAQMTQALPVAASAGDAALWTALKGAFDRADDPATRAAIVQALASFDDPALYTQTLNLLLDGTLAAQDFRPVLRGANRATRAAAWRWVTTRYDALIERIGPALAPRLPFVAAGMCTADERKAVAAFFADPAHAPQSTAHNLALVLAGIDDCIRLRGALRAPLADWLNRPAP
ncbi:MAG: alanyl aminopeptidase [Bradymonadia bacterium]|jgi:alanyl aminopeptidase